MKMRHKFLGLGWLCIFLLMACGGGMGGTETGNAIPAGVGYAVADSIDVVSGMESDPGEISFALLQQNPGLWQKVEKMLLESSAYAAGSCSSTSTCDDVAHTANTVIDFDGGCEVDSGVTATGKRFFSWFNMGDNSCPSPAAPPKVFHAIQREGATLIRATDSIDPNNFCAGVDQSVVLSFNDGRKLTITECGILSYSNFELGNGSSSVTETLSLPVAHRVLKGPQGGTAFDHVLSTTEPVKVTVQKAMDSGFPQNKLIDGIITVSHQIMKFSVKTEYQNVFFDFTQCRCYPVSGTIAITATDNQTGATLGTGSATFNAAQSGNCQDVNATFNGNPISIPLNSCRGI